MSSSSPQNPTASPYQCFVGVDIAARDFTAAILLPKQKPKLEKSPFSQDLEGITRFIDVLKATGYQAEQILVVMEATGPYWVGLALALTHNGFATSVVNPAQVHYFAKAQLKRAKSDKLDAQTLAQFAQMLLPKTWTPPPQFYYELRQRLTQRDQLLKLLGQVDNQLHALSVSPVLIESVQLQLESLQQTLSAQIKQMEQELAELIQFDLEGALSADRSQLTLDQEWQKSIALLRTIPGIGLMTACWLVVATLNFSSCGSVEALVHYVGLAPVEHTSGSSVRGRSQIGHSGNGRLRTLLFMGSLSAVRFNPLIKLFWQRLREEKNKPFKVALCACARKLLHLAYAIARSGQPFKADYQPASEPVKAA
jgi:transposase